MAEWRDESRERAEKESFWNDFLGVFGVVRRRVATYERYAKRISTGGAGFIDVFWPGYLIAEHKSRGADLRAAVDTQALDYLGDIPARQHPRLIVASDFSRFRVVDLDAETGGRGDEVEFSIDDLPRELDRFMFLAGYEWTTFRQEDAVNVDAAALLGKIYEALEQNGYCGHDLQILIVRLLFLMFADHTNLWARNLFTRYLRDRTAEDGHDLGIHLARLFDVLNKPEGRRSKALDEDLRDFPHVDGGLFADRIETPDCTRAIRDHLLVASGFDWSRISPAIFGGIFQSVNDPEERRQLGVHYTREKHIRRVIEPLFLDELSAELEACGQSRQKLLALHERLAKTQFFDPAMGCGNFLVLAYQEMRRLETALLLRLHPRNVQLTFDISAWRKVSPSQFFGIEIEAFPARIAQTTMVLVDHLENEALGKAFGRSIVDRPLGPTASVKVGNALQLDWNKVLPAKQCTYLLGNPPWAGQTTRNAEQTADLRHVWGDDYARWLDYVTGWYRKAAEYMAKSPGRAAFVSTNSITQGEQVARMWRPLLDLGVVIDFAHRTFRWSSEARGAAVVHCVIIGFSAGGRAPSRVLFEYEDIDGEPVARTVKHINPYLVDARNVLVEDRQAPLSPCLSPVAYGNKPSDGGHLIVEDADRPTGDPIATKYLRRYLGARELLHDEQRWCLWLVDADPKDLSRSAFIRDRVERVRRFRAASTADDTRRAADQPALFFRTPQPSTKYIGIPRHVSKDRRWFTVGHFPRSVIASDAIFTAVDPDGFLFGILSSAMFILWLRTIGGAIKSDLRFSGLMVYNTFPVPEPSERQRLAVIDAGKDVLAARAKHEGTCLAALYAPHAMPQQLIAAHRKLDRAVDALVAGRRSLGSESERLAVLFEQYQALSGASPAGTCPTTPGRSAARERRICYESR